MSSPQTSLHSTDFASRLSTRFYGPAASVALISTTTSTAPLRRRRSKLKMSLIHRTTTRVGVAREGLSPLWLWRLRWAVIRGSLHSYPLRCKEVILAELGGRQPLER